jgi:hypothetical protein
VEEGIKQIVSPRFGGQGEPIFGDETVLAGRRPFNPRRHIVDALRRKARCLRFLWSQTGGSWPPAAPTTIGKIMAEPRRGTMNRTIVKTVIIAGLLALAVSAYAANTITLNNPAVVNGTQLAPGQYDVKVNGNGDVRFLRGKTEVASAKARLEDRDTKARFNTVLTKPNGGGIPAIAEIQFEGKKQVLVFDNGSQMSHEGSGGGRQ